MDEHDRQLTVKAVRKICCQKCGQPYRYELDEIRKLEPRESHSPSVSGAPDA
jgi:hypothetical protein